MSPFVVTILIAMFFICFCSNVFNSSLINEEQKYVFTTCCVLVIVGTILDTTLLNLNGKGPEFVMLLKVLKCLEFMDGPAIILSLIIIVSRNQYWNAHKSKILSLVGAFYALLIASIFYPIVFSFDENANYVRTQFSIIYIVVLLLLIVIFIVMAKKSFNQNKNLRTLILTTFMIAGSMIIRIKLPESNSDWLAISMAIVIIYNYYNNSFLKIDKKTGLLNSQAYMVEKNKINYTTTFICMDLNNLKLVNDNYGHKAGDMYLSIVGEKILSVYGKAANCFRVGGDEFVVFLKKDLHNKSDYNFNIYKTIKSFMDELNEKLAVERQKYEFLKLTSGVAQGLDCILFRPKGRTTIQDPKLLMRP